MVAGFQAANASSDLFDNRAALVTQDGRKYSLRIVARQGKRVRMADTACHIA